jgi:hypothetical protein
MSGPLSKIHHLGLGLVSPRAFRPFYLLAHLHDAGDRSWSLAAGNIRADDHRRTRGACRRDNAELYTLETVTPDRDAPLRSGITATPRRSCSLRAQSRGALLASGRFRLTRQVVSFTVTEAGYYSRRERPLDPALRAPKSGDCGRPSRSGVPLFLDDGKRRAAHLAMRAISGMRSTDRGDGTACARFTAALAFAAAGCECGNAAGKLDAALLADNRGPNGERSRAGLLRLRRAALAIQRLRATGSMRTRTSPNTMGRPHHATADTGVARERSCADADRHRRTRHP